MLDKQLVNELFELWQNLAEAGELHIGKGYSEKMQVLEMRVNKYNSLHNVRLSFTSIDKAVNDLNLNKRVKWFVWNGELVRKGSMCPEPVIVNGTPVLINEA